MARELDKLKLIYNRKIERITHSIITNKDKTVIIDKLRKKYSLTLLLSIANLKRSTFYYNLNHDIDYKNKDIIKKIKEIFYINKHRYGYRRITLELKNQGYIINHKKVKRLMTKLGLMGLNQKKDNKYHINRKKKGKTINNLLLTEISSSSGKTILKRDFNAITPNEKWVTDISMFKIKYGKLYLSPIIDLYDKSVIAYTISPTQVFVQVTEMLDLAFKDNMNLKGLIFHSDQGWQYQEKEYQLILKEKGIRQSMSRKGNCLDNAPAENFFSIMKNEMFYGKEKTFKSLKDLKNKMIKYLEYYNYKRISIKRNGLTPIEYRKQALLLINSNNKNV